MRDWSGLIILLGLILLLVAMLAATAHGQEADDPGRDCVAVYETPLVLVANSMQGALSAERLLWCPVSAATYQPERLLLYERVVIPETRDTGWSLVQVIELPPASSPAADFSN